MLTLIYQNTEYKIHSDNIPEQCYLHNLMHFNTDDIIIMDDDVHLDIIVPLLNGTLDFTMVGSFEKLTPILDFHNLKIYDLVYGREQYIRDNLYNDNDKFIEHDMNVDTHYNLIELTEDMFNMIAPDYANVSLNPNVIFENTLINRTWADAQNILREYPIDYTNTVIAGGAVFSALFKSYASDVDLFIYGTDEETALNQIKTFTSTNNTGIILRTTNSLTFHMNRVKYQYILRLYTHKHEIIHGFDVDSCCCLYDGEKIWVTERFMLAITSGYNYLNLKLLSPSYEYRLAKYCAKGMRIFIPGFTRENVLDEKIYKEFVIRTGKRYYRCACVNKRYKDIMYVYVDNTLICDDPNDKYHNAVVSKNILFELSIHREEYNQSIFSKYTDDYKQMSGLDILIFIEYMVKHSEYSYTKSMEKLTYEHSDYDVTPNVQKIIKTSEKPLTRTMSDMYEDAELYPDEWDTIYTQYYEIEITTCLSNIPIGVITNNFPSAPIYYIGMLNTDVDMCNDHNYDYIFDVPDIDYNIFQYTGGINLPQHMRLKKTNPGEQMTNTFNSIVLEDNDIWYNGIFYQI